jgi:NAD(P) transhydrogenase subunit beta
VTFTGSVIAYGKLAGTSSRLPFRSQRPKKLPGGHMLNAAAAALSLVLLFGI